MFAGYDASDHLRYVLLKEHREADDTIFQLLGPLYGQRSASRRWHKTFKRWLASQGYVADRNEPCAFYHEGTQDAKEVKTVHVDTMYNMADLLTKCLSNTDFNRLVQLIITQQNNDRAVRLVQFARAKVHERPA